ncbi:hypothetical protein B0H63DRAFT_514481 [Podospora didyma]|uniref:Uncharacterized protein n=1 Tax=Podospora didyma TaxID=330526 RepID=A0AAE0K569_9PEZI|nr:hypothetical protein B0H63DRAFT_514481 [Podospora didyma]
MAPVFILPYPPFVPAEYSFTAEDIVALWTGGHTAIVVGLILIGIFGGSVELEHFYDDYADMFSIKPRPKFDEDARSISSDVIRLLAVSETTPLLPPKTPVASTPTRTACQ